MERDRETRGLTTATVIRYGSFSEADDSHASSVVSKETEEVNFVFWESLCDRTKARVLTIVIAMMVAFSCGVFLWTLLFTRRSEDCTIEAFPCLVNPSHNVANVSKHALSRLLRGMQSLSMNQTDLATLSALSALSALLGMSNQTLELSMNLRQTLCTAFGCEGCLTSDQNCEAMLNIPKRHILPAIVVFGLIGLTALLLGMLALHMPTKSL